MLNELDDYFAPPEPLDLGLRSAVKAGVTSSVRDLMHWGIENEVRHANIVAAGAYDFRRWFTKDMHIGGERSRLPLHDLANVTFRFFDQLWKRTHPGVTAAQFLDAVHIASPPTTREINDAWTLEIGSDEQAMAKNYEGSARTRKGADLGAKRPS